MCSVGEISIEEVGRELGGWVDGRESTHFGKRADQKGSCRHVPLKIICIVLLTGTSYYLLYFAGMQFKKSVR